MNNIVNFLLGNKIQKINLSGSKNVLTIYIDVEQSGKNHYVHKEHVKLEIVICLKEECAGCVSAYVNSIEGLEEIINNKIIKIVEHTSFSTIIDEDNVKSYMEFLKEEGDEVNINKVREDSSTLRVIYNIDIVTEKGTCTIDFRNDSEGSYGILSDFLMFSVEIIREDGTRYFEYVSDGMSV